MRYSKAMGGALLSGVVSVLSGCGPQPLIVEAGGAQVGSASGEPTANTNTNANTRAPLMVAGSAPPRQIAAGPLDCGGQEQFALGGRGYCINRTELPFADADDACRSMRGHLVTIAAREEQEALRARFAPAWTPQGPLWIGLVEPFREGDWRWVTGEAARFQAFGAGEPNDLGGEDCGEWSATDGAWNDVNCFLGRPYICEGSVAARKGVASQLGCGQDGQRFTAGSKDLCAHTGFLPFAEAQASCQKAGGTLAVIRSAAENSDMQRAFGPKIGAVGAVWIGISDQEQEGRFSWTTGEAADFTSWSSGEPNNDGSNEDCGTWLTSTGAWNDVPCDARLWSLCEGSL